MKRLIIIALASVICTACTPAQVEAWFTLQRDDQQAIVEHIVRDAAASHDVDADLLVRIVRCESGMRPDAMNPTSHALGLGQHLPQYWPARAEALGYDPSLWYDPAVNADVTAWMLATQGTAPWNPSKHCWAR